MSVRTIAHDFGDGKQYAAIECFECLHTQPPGGVCLLCQPYPAKRRCVVCEFRGDLVADEAPSMTATVRTTNDQPT
jgi:hypothetical protein